MLIRKMVRLQRRVCVACYFSIVVFFFDQPGDISGLKQSIKFNLHVYYGSASLQGKSTGCLCNPSYKIQYGFFFSSSFLFHPLFPCNCNSIYFIITTFLPSKILSLLLAAAQGLHGLCFGHNQSHENPKQTRLGHVFAVPPVSHGSVWNFFCSNQQLQEEIMSSYFLSAVVNTSILS